MISVRRRERFIENQRSVLESCIDVTVGPLVGRFPHRQLTIGHSGKVLRRPLHLLHRRSRRWTVRRWGPRCPHVAGVSGVGPTRPQRVERVDVERQRFPVDLDLLYGIGRDQFAVRSHGEHGISAVHWLVRERSLAPDVRLDDLTEVGNRVGRAWHIVSGENRPDAGNRQRLRQLYASYTCVRHRA
jgi:hypothetical protein